MGNVRLELGDSLDVLKTLDSNSVDAVVSDPPYGLEFMGKSWDTFKTGRGAKYKSGGVMQEDVSIPGTGFTKLPSYTNRPAKRCAICGKQAWSGSPCVCENPEWEMDNSVLHSFQEFNRQWAKECLRVLKPGGYLLAFGGTRMVHRLTAGIEDAGFEIRDMIAWVYGSGFPKSLNIGKAIDARGGNAHLTKEIGEAIKQARKKRGMTASECDQLFCGGTTNWSWFEGRPTGQRAPTSETFSKIAEQWPELLHLADSVAEAEREVIGKKSSGIGTAFGDGEWLSGKSEEVDITAPATEQAKQWEGWGTALKPALEPITVARKPIEGTVAENCLKWGVGGIDIDGSRVGTEVMNNAPAGNKAGGNSLNMSEKGMPQDADGTTATGRFPANLLHDGSEEVVGLFPNDSARFFYSPKASKSERNMGCEGMEDRARPTMGSGIGGQPDQQRANNKNIHPTVKPIALMEYLVKLVSREGATVLDPFMGSGSTGIACVSTGRNFIGIEREAEYLEIAKARIAAVPQRLL